MKISKAQAIDYIILCLRWYLAIYMIMYGWGKMTGEQFGINDPGLLDKPLREVDKFHLAWYIFGQSKVFEFAVGLSQIAGAILIVIPRTRLIGALILLPILANIFLIDVCFTTGVFGPALQIRLFCMMLVDIAILYHSKAQVLSAWQSLSAPRENSSTFKWWLLRLLPLIGFLMDFIFAILSWPVKMIWLWLFVWPHK